MADKQRFGGSPPPGHVWEGLGLRIAGDSWGQSSNRLVVLLHGGGQTRHTWQSTAEHLVSWGYYVVAFDARGHGDSDWAADANYDQDQFVGDLQCILETLGKRRPILLGASLGGDTSLVAVGEGKVEAAALILIDVDPRTERSGSERIKSFMEQASKGFASMDEVAHAISTYRTDGTRPSDSSRLSKNVRLWPDGRYRWNWDPQFVATREKDLAHRYTRLSACARQLTVPTLLVRGGSSDVVSEDGVRDFLGLCPHAEYVNVAGAGHMGIGDSNDVFSRSTLDFLGRHAPALEKKPWQRIRT